MPNNPVLRFLTPPLRDLLTYPVKKDSEYIYINVQGIKSGNSAEIVFGGATQAGKTASDVSVDEVLRKDSGFLPFSFLLKNLCSYTLYLLLRCTTNRVELLALQKNLCKTLFCFTIQTISTADGMECICKFCNLSAGSCRSLCLSNKIFLTSPSHVVESLCIYQIPPPES